MMSNAKEVGADSRSREPGLASRLGPSGFDRGEATPYSFCWRDEPESLAERALQLVLSMASVKCRNEYPVGVIGREARCHYTEARRIAAIARETRSAETLGSVGEADEARPSPKEGL